MDANELLEEYYPTIDHVELGELYCRDKVIIIMKEYAEKWHDTELNKLKQADVSGRSELLFTFIAEVKKEFADQNWDYLDFIAERVLKVNNSH